MPEPATKAAIASLEQMIEQRTWQLTVRLGGLIVAGFGLLVMLELLPSS